MLFIYGILFMSLGTAFAWVPWTRNKRDSSLTAVWSPNAAQLVPEDLLCIPAWKLTRTVIQEAVIPSGESPPSCKSDLMEKLPGFKKFIPESSNPIVTGSSTLFFGSIISITGSRISSVAKYTNNCAALFLRKKCTRSGVATCGLRSEDELMDEYKMNKAAEFLDILPKVLYISSEKPITTFTDIVQLGTGSVSEGELMKEIAEECLKGQGKVRMMIQERIGMDMKIFYHNSCLGPFDKNRYKLILRTYIRIGLELIQMLEKLHDIGIIHGDVHKGNVAFPTADNDWNEFVKPEYWASSSRKLVLLDLGYARFYPDDIGKNQVTARDIHINKVFQSPWHIVGYRIARRDDVYRAMEIVLTMMIPNASELFNESFSALKNDEFSAEILKKSIPANKVTIAKNKMYVNLFENGFVKQTYTDQRPRLLSLEQEAFISEKLDAIMNQIRAIPTVDSRPAYSEYIAKLEEVITYIDNFAK